MKIWLQFGRRFVLPVSFYWASFPVLRPSLRPMGNIVPALCLLFKCDWPFLYLARQMGVGPCYLPCSSASIVSTKLAAKKNPPLITKGREKGDDQRESPAPPLNESREQGEDWSSLLPKRIPPAPHGR